MKEKTIQDSISCDGIGLHSGRLIHMSLRPAEKGRGIAFVRKDLGGITIPADAAHVIPSSLSTILESNGATVQTVEHLMAAVSALEIDNLIIELDGPELPALDGSAFPFIALLQKAGLVEQKKSRAFIEILKPMTISENGKSITVRPGSSFEVSCQISFNHPVISDQAYHYWHSRQAFIRELASARTFGFLKDATALQSNGLALGVSLDNAIVIDDEKVMNEGGLRYPDEFVRHKVLDLIGDFALLGAPILGRIEAVCSGHKLHAEMVQEIMKNKKAWRMVTASAGEETTPVFRPRFQALPVTV